MLVQVSSLLQSHHTASHTSPRLGDRITLKLVKMLHQLYPREDGYTDRGLYPYNPSETAAYAFVAMFALAGVTHLILMFPYRAWFLIPMIIGTAST